MSPEEEKKKSRFGTKDKIFFGILAVGLVFILVQKILPGRDENQNELTRIKVGENFLSVKVADEQEERRQGLSGVTSLGENQGMLFVFGGPGRSAFVMRGMNFDLDFIFIGEGRVVDIAKNVGREFDGQVIGGADYDQVLEVRAGWVQKNGVEIGDEVEIKD